MTMLTRPRAVVRAPRRSRQWAQRIINFTVASTLHAGLKTINLLSELETDLGMQFSNVTVSALNFNINYRLTSSTTGDDTTVTLGIAWVGLDAFTVGGLSLPDPSTDHYDWMFWDTRTMSSSRDVTDVDEQVFNSQLEIRNRSMRKQRENHSVLALMVVASTLGPVTLQVFVGGRSLVLLP